MTIELYGHEIDEDELFEACLDAERHNPVNQFYISAVYFNKDTGELRVSTDFPGDYMEPDSDWVRIYSATDLFDEYYPPLYWYLEGVNANNLDYVMDDVAEKLNLSDTEKTNLKNLRLAEFKDFCFDNSETLNKAILNDEDCLDEAAHESIDNFIDDLKHRREENYNCR